jgi:hypothetical protein
VTNTPPKTTDCSSKKKKPKPEKGYSPITKKKYDEMFRGNGNPQRINKLENAHKLAWETRNFEIDKFWIRTAFFGGFIALIFNAYINMVSSSHPALIGNFDIYLILLGIIFSFAWLLSILGSKCWQENWEAHIDMLEDDITGPVYKTIYCKKWFYYYSVSKINIFLAVVIIMGWVIMLFMSTTMTKEWNGIDFDIKTGIILTVIIVVLMFLLCRSSGDWKIKKSMRKLRKNEFESGVLTHFIDRYE